MSRFIVVDRQTVEKGQKDLLQLLQQDPDAHTRMEDDRRRLEAWATAERQRRDRRDEALPPRPDKR